MAGETTISNSESRIEALDLQSSAFGVTIPVVYGLARFAGNLIWYGDFRATAHTSSDGGGGKGGGVTTQNTTYSYSASVVMGLCEGTIGAVPRVWVGKRAYANSATAGTALAQLGVTLASGTLAQATWPYLITNFSAQALGYSGLAHAYAQNYALTGSAQVDNHSWEVQGLLAYAVAGVPDANPAAILSDLLPNTRYGASFPAAQIGSLTNWSNYCLANNLLLSTALTEQMQAGELVNALGKLTNTAPVWSGGELKMVPYGDADAAGNGASYTANVTPVYDLTDDDFCPDGADDDPVQVTRKPQADAYNHIRVEFLNRGSYDAANGVYTGGYNIEIAEAKDSASIDAHGLRSADVVRAHWICDAAIARNVAQLLLQHVLYIRNTFEFTLPWTKALLEPMDLVTLTDGGLGYAKLPVRITEITENDDRSLSVLAQEFPLGVASAATYQHQLSAGFQSNYSAAPGNVLAPFIFEAPVERTLTGLEVYAAVTGPGPSWGGCRVWVSLDGANYKDKGIIYGGARYGALTGALSAGNLPVAINSGQLISGSAADSANLATLCYVGGANPEYLAYTTAALTGAQAYTLAGLTRNAFGSNSAGAAHASGESFARIDDAIAKSGALDLSLIGKTIHFKFTSFNIYHAAEQSLADVPAYTYTVAGTMAQLPPAAVTGIGASVEPFGLRIFCNKNAEPDVQRYEYRVGASWASATVLETDGGTSYLWQVHLATAPVVWIAAVDFLGNYSPPVSLAVTIPVPSAPVLSHALDGPDEVLSWSRPASGFAIDSYEIRRGASWAAGTFVDTTKATSYRRRVDYLGERTWWVAAIDAAGNVGTAGSVVSTVAAPGAVTALRAEVIDNNVLIYWSPPASGSLPVERYEAREGASWGAGASIGSNGNSTFASVFEQVAGSYSYWVAPVDSAGNVGAESGTTVYISQPPDYVLRASIDSTLAGTKVNAVLDGGTLLLPVNTSETWTEHFTNRGWNTPQDQIDAGYPIYIEPGVATASYTEEIDYGSVLPTTNIQVTLASTAVAGSVAASCQISTKLNAGDAWTNAPAGAASALAISFRYVRVVWTFSATPGANLLRVTGLNVKISVKQRGDSGSGTAAVGGTFVPFNYAFLSADTPIVQPEGSTPLIAVVIYSGGPNPTGFTVRLYNLAGVEVGGNFSWSVRGY